MLALSKLLYFTDWWANLVQRNNKLYQIKLVVLLCTKLKGNRTPNQKWPAGHEVYKDVASGETVGSFQIILPMQPPTNLGC